MAKKQITIRGREADDWADIHAIFSREAIYRQTPNLPYPSADLTRQAVAEPRRGWRYLVAEVDQDGESNVVGELGLCHYVRKARRKHAAEFFIVVHPDYQGQGIGSALMEALVNLADNWLGLRRLELQVFVDNAPAIALYERFGFEIETTLRRYTIRDGAFIDAHGMSRINTRLGGRRKQHRKVELPPRHPNKDPVTIKVRGTKADDWADLYKVFCTPGVYSNTLQLPYPSPDMIRRRTAEPPDDFHSLAAVIAGQVVGMCGLHLNRDRRAYTADIGMMVHPDYHGIGVGSALMEAVIELAERWHQIRRIGLEVFPDNPAAIALYEKFNFEREGLLRDYAFQDGAYADTLAMSRLCD